MTNEHVVHLATIAKVGTKVKVLQAYNGGDSQSAPLSSLFSFGVSNEPQKPAVKPRPSKPLVKKAVAARTTVTAPPVAPKVAE